jgi:hydroxymethylpyrimidine pyrophosphatase-like HAD family hydrolase
MSYTTIATDYDGTLAHDGQVDDETIEALTRARAAGLRLVMVTGRELDDLFSTFPETALFDRIVAENGALLYDPARRSRRLLAPSPPPELVQWLRDRRVPLSVGASIVATVQPHEHVVLDAIRELGLEWHVIFNKGAVMVLPAGVTKATGLGPALDELGVSPATAIGIGDAENDHAFLQFCGVGVAVANALASVKARADLVTQGARGAGVVELIDRLLENGLDDVPPRRAAHA